MSLSLPLRVYPVSTTFEDPCGRVETYSLCSRQFRGVRLGFRIWGGINCKLDILDLFCRVEVILHSLPEGCPFLPPYSEESSGFGSGSDLDDFDHFSSVDLHLTVFVLGLSRLRRSPNGLSLLPIQGRSRNTIRVDSYITSRWCASRILTSHEDTVPLTTTTSRTLTGTRTQSSSLKESWSSLVSYPRLTYLSIRPSLPQPPLSQ